MKLRNSFLLQPISVLPLNGKLIVMVHNYGTIGSFENKSDKKKYKIGVGFVILGFSVAALLLISLGYSKDHIGDLMMSK